MEESALVVTAATSVLDIISGYRQTEGIFKDLEAETGRCICCEGLFLSLGEAAARFGFDLNGALARISAVIADQK